MHLDLEAQIPSYMFGMSSNCKLRGSKLVLIVPIPVLNARYSTRSILVNSLLKVPQTRLNRCGHEPGRQGRLRDRKTLTGCRRSSCPDALLMSLVAFRFGRCPFHSGPCLSGWRSRTGRGGEHAPPVLLGRLAVSALLVQIARPVYRNPFRGREDLCSPLIIPDVSRW